VASLADRVVDAINSIPEDVFSDFDVDPGPPFAAAPLAGEISGRKKGEEEPRVGESVMDIGLPIGQRGDVALVEEQLHRNENGRGAVPRHAVAVTLPK